MTNNQFQTFLTQLIEVSDGYDDNDFGQEILEYDYLPSDDAEQYLKEDYAELMGQALLDEADYYNNLYLDNYGYCQGEF
jgi:hypothetical protein